MELYSILINVNGQILTLDPEETPPEIASGDSGIDFVNFNFADDKWDTMTEKWAVFSRAYGEPYKVELTAENKAEVPAVVMQAKGILYIGLFGTDGENIQTSNVLEYNLLKGCINAADLTPPPDIYEQFIADLAKYNQALTDLERLETEVGQISEDLATVKTDLTNIENTAAEIEETFTTIDQTLKGYTEESKRYAELAEEAAEKSGYLYFEINSNRSSATYGHLLMTRTENTAVTFELENGHLYLKEA